MKYHCLWCLHECHPQEELVSLWKVRRILDSILNFLPIKMTESVYRSSYFFETGKFLYWLKLCGLLSGQTAFVQVLYNWKGNKSKGE